METTLKLSEIEGEIVRSMSFGHNMIATNVHVFVADRRTNRRLLGRLRDMGVIEHSPEHDATGKQTWLLSEKGKAWAKENS